MRAEMHLPTAWQEVETSWSKGVRLFVKRDDLIHPLISGNKWRKLKGFLDPHPEAERIHTFGGAYSNHLLAVAGAANALGLSSKGVVRGEHPPRPGTVLQLCRRYGMELEFVSRTDYRALKQRSGLEGSTLWVPEGGQGEPGMIGCAEILTERPIELDQCFVACGTGTTLAGMLPAANGLQLIGVPVLKPGDFIQRDVEQWSGERAELDLDHHFGGYARTNAELMRFIRQFAMETGILLDPIYTGKAFYAARTRIRDGRIPAGSKVGLVHTGGLGGWYGKWTEPIG